LGTFLLSPTFAFQEKPTLTGHHLEHHSAWPVNNGRKRVLETSLSGVFAAGDVRVGSTKQVTSAAGEGATAALLIREHLNNS
jgi:thioredoxin reductase